MRRWVTALALVLSVSFVLVGCGKAASTTSATGTDGTSFTCPTTAQKTLVKTRFAADIGLIIGTTRHFIYTPYKAGAFASGASGRIKAIVKGALAGAAVLKLTDNAINNAKADPLLCNALVQPLISLKGALGGLKSKLMGGDTSALSGLDGTLTGIEGTAKSQGLSVVSGLIPGL